MQFLEHETKTNDEASSSARLLALGLWLAIAFDLQVHSRLDASAAVAVSQLIITQASETTNRNRSDIRFHKEKI